MNIKINSYEIISLVITAVYLKNAAIPWEVWEVGGVEPMVIILIKYIMLLLILIPLIILYNGLKQEQE